MRFVESVTGWSGVEAFPENDPLRVPSYLKDTQDTTGVHFWSNNVWIRVRLDGEDTGVLFLRILAPSGFIGGMRVRCYSGMNVLVYEQVLLLDSIMVSYQTDPIGVPYRFVELTLETGPWPLVDPVNLTELQAEGNPDPSGTTWRTLTGAGR